MCTIVEARLPAEQFALHETLDRVPDATFESVRLSAVGGDPVLLPFFRASTDGDTDIADTELAAWLERDSSIEAVDEVATVADGSLFRFEWAAPVRITLRIMLEQGSTLIDARAANGTWWFRLLFPEHDDVGATYEACEDHDIDLEPERVYQLRELVGSDRFGMTGQQLETIQLAYESGYYEVPRKVTLKDLAGRADISHQALSERFRRGHCALVENTLVGRPL